MSNGWFNWIAGLTILLGLMLGNPLIMVPGMLLMMVSAAAWFWVEVLPRHLHARVSLSRQRARWGEQVSGAVELVNDQPFPMPWVECTVNCSAQLKAGGIQLNDTQSQPSTLHNTLALRWFEKVVRPFTVDCRIRGELSFGPTTLETSDPFGFFSGKKSLDNTRRLLVYPRTVPINTGRTVRTSPFGDQSALSWIFDDPARFHGSREYRPSDPFSRIEWKATARTGLLHTRVFDASFAAEVALVVNMNTREQVWHGTNAAILERTVMLAASVVQSCYQTGCRFAVYTNGFVRSERSSVLLKMGAGEKHLVGAMELLARVMPTASVAPGRVLAAAGAAVREHTQILVITALITSAFERELVRQRSLGRRVTVLYTGKMPPQALNAIPVYTILEKEPWDELSAITLVKTG